MLVIVRKLMPYSDNISDISATINDDPLRAIESAFDTLGNDITDEKTRNAVKAIARAIIDAIVYERTLNDAKITAAVSSVSGLRADIQRLIAVSEQHASHITNRVHSLSNFMMGVENRIDELSQLITARYEAEEDFTITGEDDITE